ncbi:Hypothetical predicted protein [Paramuricea clavata]|uniref:HMG domain-containing protein n=1 Tax=Paramuricea clavata TaxID=317549 RepID=A0A6S7FSJ2_PARCT|nr:Hypothetical predicted protein [Paramuricea clavata]
MRQQPIRVKCPFADCGREFHPNSLSTHIKAKHDADERKRVESGRYLNGTCVDYANGIYLVRKQFRGTDHPVHCQFKTSCPASVVCSVDTCRQLSSTASRSGQANFLCDHLKSTQFICPSVVAHHLQEDSLNFVVDTLKWLKLERKSECLEWQKEAAHDNVPLVVQMPLAPESSTRFYHFSMDEEIGDTQDFPTATDENVADEHSPGNGENLPIPSTMFYPPAGNVALNFVKYLLDEKKIPPQLPLALTVQKENFDKSYIPTETNCFYCKTQLTEPYCITQNAKLVTLKGIIEGISLYVKFCNNCKLPYRYQEFADGVHNFNDNWLLSYGICDMIRKHLQVHNAVSRTVEAIENWLQLRPYHLPRGPMLNAYLHFEALSEHSYGFSCLMCGHFPPLLTLDA